MKFCLRLYTFIFAIWPNLAKYTSGQLPFEEHHKIEKKKRKKHCYAVKLRGTGCSVVSRFLQSTLNQ
jgi:hypothetical protein